MGLGVGNWFELLDLLDRHLNFALEGLVFLLTSALLTVHSGGQWTTLA